MKFNPQELLEHLLVNKASQFTRSYNPELFDCMPDLVATLNRDMKLLKPKGPSLEWKRLDGWPVITPTPPTGVVQMLYGEENWAELLEWYRSCTAQKNSTKQVWTVAERARVIALLGALATILTAVLVKLFP